MYNFSIETRVKLNKLCFKRAPECYSVQLHPQHLTNKHTLREDRKGRQYIQDLYKREKVHAVRYTASGIRLGRRASCFLVCHDLLSLFRVWSAHHVADVCGNFDDW
jgi:hypothetical protein